MADTAPPPWWTRGETGTTYLDTGFPDDRSPAVPETFLNPNGVPSVYAVGTWSPLVDTYLGVWDISSGGYLQVHTPNYGSSAGTALSIQMVYSGQGSYQPAITVNGETGTLLGHQDLPGLGRWEYGQWYFELSSGPSSELISIMGDIAIDQVTVDTCVLPEPSTLLLAAFGAGFMLAARRRK